MKVTYDKETDALYIQFKAEKINESDEDKNGVMIIDYAADGSVIGIEVLNASEKLSLPVELDFIET
ncbi:DUF2283 domain-containing protein [uncultured Mucilaginibacter sp.]|uniref:DUF2283 domain-containing protein n=1 Tax=uncultured Mucilaginibacter sp. TaxID=797541 RepID=UPI0025EC0186|nr:DUF2283 domain-containing protein [uncultured Mucilaginibacter sp.]